MLFNVAWGDRPLPTNFFFYTNSLPDPQIFVQEERLEIGAEVDDSWTNPEQVRKEESGVCA